MLRPTLLGLLRRDFGGLLLAVLIPPSLLLGMATHGYSPWWALIGLGAFAIAGAVAFVRAAMSSISVAGGELRSQGQFTRAARCWVSNVKRLYLSNEGVIFGMTRPWGLWVDLQSGEHTCLYGDVKRLDWLAVFRLADHLNLRCEGPAAPYLALVACGSRRQPSERGSLTQGGGWPLIQNLRRRATTGKLIFKGSSGDRWIYLIRGRNLRLEEDWPRQLTPAVTSPSDDEYEFQPSALSDKEVALVLHLDDIWLGAPPDEEMSPAQASG